MEILKASSLPFSEIDAGLVVELSNGDDQRLKNLISRITTKKKEVIMSYVDGEIGFLPSISTVLLMETIEKDEKIEMKRNMAFFIRFIPLLFINRVKDKKSITSFESLKVPVKHLTKFLNYIYL
jgi:hypothetical protein